jgi:hypothetical protein
MRSSYQHPGYPLAIAATRRVAGICGLLDIGHSPESVRDTMLLSAQLVNLAAGCLLAIAMFYLGKELFNRRVGFWTAAVFQCLPVAARVMSDALSEATFLLAVTVTLLLAVRSLRDYSVWRLGLCGVCGGCSFLIRPEGGLGVLAVAATLLAMQALPRWRLPWGQFLLATATLAVATALVAGPYVAVLGSLTNKPTGKAVMDLACEDTSLEDERIEDRGSKFEDRGLRIEDRGLKIENRESKIEEHHDDPPGAYASRLACLWGVWWHDNREGDWFEHLTWGVWAMAQVVVRVFGYVAWLPAVLGLYWHRSRSRKQPKTLILGLLCLFQILVLCRVGLVVGYVSERHVLIIVLCGLYWAVWATLQLPKHWLKLSRKLARSSQESKIKDRKGFSFSGLYPRSSILGPGVLVIFMLACLPVSLQPLHANQVGHREAGLWLAQHAQPSDIIVDPFDWAYFYAGRVFQSPQGSAVGSQRPMRYVVLETIRKPHPELIMLPLAEKLAEDGQLVFDWQPDRHQLEHKAQEVQVFAVPIP